MRKSMLVVAMCALCACKAPTPPASSGPAAPAAATSTVEAPAPVATAMPPAATTVATPAFVDKVWRAQASTAVEPGTTYAFLADGTLVIDAPNGTPSYGRWTYENDKLAMTEEGITYPTDILKLDAGTFQIRSNNPGGAVEITLALAPDAPLPEAPVKK